ncbi:flagellar filament capping protein FliD [Pseudomonas sp.]|uniref:flagellar filament capping protein FliD n=1 Tax=Pseudomonas sp. TaxID=306 RepID=UPI0028A97936|nr:flagellar filament capping protein FliD [Pseudomonas sp.]
MAGTTVSGLGSGIDTASIVKALVNAEKAPKLSQITNQRDTAKTTLSAVGSLKSALETFQAAMSKLNNTSAFLGLNASSSSESSVKVVSSNTAVNGSYAINVTNIATSSKIATKIIDASATTTTDGKLTITQGGGEGGAAGSYEVDIPAGSDLADVRDLINSKLQSQGVTANILTDSSGSRLVLSSTKTGAGTDLSIKTTDNDLSEFIVDGAAQVLRDGEFESGFVTARPVDANFSIDGLVMKSASNELTKTVSGLTLTLVENGSSTVTVATNKEGLKTSVQTFVDAYNALVKTANSLTQVTPTVGTDSTSTQSSPLTGDATVRSLFNEVRKELLNISGGGGSISMLSQLGVMTKRDGSLEVDSTKLDKALTNDSTAIEKFFTGETGLLSRLNKDLDKYTQSQGILDKRSTTLQGKLNDLTDEETALNSRIEKLEATLSAKYNAMDSLIAQLNATSTSVMTTLNALNNQKD